MRVDYLCTYYSQYAHENIEQRSQALWDAYKFCGAVKNGVINGYCTVPFKKPLRIAAANVSEAREIFGRFIDLVCGKQGYQVDALVPAPSKDSFASDQYRSRLMVEACKPECAPVLAAAKFTAHLQPSSQGGPRGYENMYPHIAAVDGIKPRRVVLVDDIVTSGGTLLATAERLTNAGYDVLGAIACGRTSDIRERPFKLRNFELANEHAEDEADVFG